MCIHIFKFLQIRKFYELATSLYFNKIEILFTTDRSIYTMKTAYERTVAESREAQRKAKEAQKEADKVKEKEEGWRIAYIDHLENTVESQSAEIKELKNKLHK